MNSVAVTVEWPLSTAIIRKKVAAWKEIFGTEPGIYLTGTYRATIGDLAFCSHSKVVTVGNKYVTMIDCGEKFSVDPSARTFSRDSRDYYITLRSI